MSTKVAYSQREDKQELQKQLGCMNGIFQLFDRRYLLGQRRHGQNQKRLSPGRSDNGEKEFSDASEIAKEKTSKKVVKEKHRVSVESSRNSFSSSCSSTTFSSLDCSKRVQTEQSSFCQIISEPTSPILHKKQSDISLQPPDIRDVVKNSMTREPRVVSVRTVAKDERAGPAMKHIDSPRPFLHQKSVQYDRKDQNLAKLSETSREVKEVKETSRFSCDGRESRYSLKPTVKVKELPRLSLDSKQSSIRNSTNESRRSLTSETLNPTHEPGSNKRPSSSVVARLMGLEMLTDPINEVQTLKIKPSWAEEQVLSSGASRKGEEFKHNHVSVSPRFHKELASPQRAPLEPAPWKHEGGGRRSEKPPFEKKDASAIARHASPSVYGEIEKRLSEIEFKTSGKDLRALKQILEAMQKTRRRLEEKEQPLDGNFDQRQSESDEPVSPMIKRTSPLRAAMKPVKLTTEPMIITGHQKVNEVNRKEGRKNLVGRQLTRDLTPRDRKATGMTQRSMSPSKVPDYLIGERSTTSRISEAVSPRLQKPNNGIVKQSICGPSSDSSRIKRQSYLQPDVSDLKTKIPKSKSIHALKSNEKSARNSNQRGDKVSSSSESNTSMNSQNESEVRNNDWNQGINCVYQSNDNHRNNYAERLVEDKTRADHTTLTTEQPSPVSVLDAFYTEDPPSPVKKKSDAFNDDESLHFGQADWNRVGINNLVNNADQDQCSDFKYIRLDNIKHLVHQIEALNSVSAEDIIINTASSPSDSKNGDHEYITEIISASGFLKDLASAATIVQLHPTGSLINPELFHILERTKGSAELADDEYHKRNTRSKSKEKIRRKLVFDAVNDILVHKLAISGSYGVWTTKSRGRLLNGEKLIKELSSEIDTLHRNSDRGLYDEDDEVINIISADMNKTSEDWHGYCNEVPGLALDIERLIFKDLISEIVNAEVAGQQDRPDRHCRQLFPM